MENEFGLLYACNHPGKPAYVVSLSEAFPVSDISEAETLGLIRRDPVQGRSYFSLTPAGKDRLLVLYALREERAYSAQQQREQRARHQAEQEEQTLRVEYQQSKNRRNVLQAAVIGAFCGALFTFVLDHLDALLQFLQQSPLH